MKNLLWFFLNDTLRKKRLTCESLLLHNKFIKKKKKNQCFSNAQPKCVVSKEVVGIGQCNCESQAISKATKGVLQLTETEILHSSLF